MLTLNEDLFQDAIPSVETTVLADSDIEPEGPEEGIEVGISNLIHDLIINENEIIQQYNNAAINMEEYPELQDIMHHIATTEFEHIGELQKALEMVSPNASSIEVGETSYENITEEPLEEDTEKKSNGKWVNKGSEGEHGEFKTKKEADAQRKAMYANGWRG